MTRRPVLFPCEGNWLVGTVDEAPGTRGLLIVTGGNEVRSGAWAGQAQLAARIAAAGFPVMRFDRRGVGDSEGGNGGYNTSGPDIAAALAAFREEVTQLSRVIGWGNCDGASALMLAGGAGCDGLVLSNPWTLGEEAEGEAPAPPPPEMLRDHYKRRLRDPAALKRLLTGKVGLKSLLSSLRSAATPAAPKVELTGLAREMDEGLAGFAGDIRFLIAERDRTGQAFRAAWHAGDPRIRLCPDATHSFVEAEAWEWLEAQLLDALNSA